MPIQPKQQPPYYEPGTGISTGTKYYRANLTQSGTNAPVATIFLNSLNATLTYTYDGIGFYLITASEINTFPLGKTQIFIGSEQTVNDQIKCRHNEDVDNKELRLISANAGTEGNNIIYETPIQIIVNP